MNKFVFQTTPKLVCALGSAEQLSEHLGSDTIKRVFWVTDQGVLNAGIADRPIQTLRDAGYDVTVYSQVQADPPETMVIAAVEAAVACKAQAVVGFGGGSSLDTAKLVALLAKSPQPLETIYGVGLAKGERLPLIQVPTTAGTGSEVTPISIVTTPSDEKKGVVSSVLLPDVAILDGLLTIGVPPAITAMTGVDAMVHAIESYTSLLKKNPVSDALGKQALELLYRNLPKVIRDGSDAPARQAMLLGSMLAGMAFANAPVAAVHALAYPLGGIYHLPHGLSNSLMLEPVLKFNYTHAIGPYADLGRVIDPSLIGVGDDQAAQQFVERIVALVNTMPFAKTLTEAGIPGDAVEQLAAAALKQQRLLVNNPRPVTHADAVELYLAAL